MAAVMSSATRLSTALSHREPDRVPLMLPANLHGAAALGVSPREYFSRAELVVEGQLRLQRRLGNDALVAALYAAQEIEAFGGETLFREDGPPNAGPPVLRSAADIDRLEPPRFDECPTLLRVLSIIEGFRERVGDEIPIVCQAISPFSLPVMQMGFEAYLVLMYEDPQRFARLMAVNEVFFVSWANAQLQAGASTIVYADPVSSPSMIPREKYLSTGFRIARRSIGRVRGDCAMTFASAAALPIVDLIQESGARAVSAGATDDLAALKQRCAGRLGVMGNLNGIEMRRWTAQDAVANVKRAIAAAGTGGGFVLTDSHGEIPLQVREDTLLEVAEAARCWGRYPLDWVSRDGR